MRPGVVCMYLYESDLLCNRNPKISERDQAVIYFGILAPVLVLVLGIYNNSSSTS